jgi:hypothetical protein
MRKTAMKLNEFNTTIASNVPRVLKLRDPFTNETLIDENGQTLDFYLYGMSSDIARNAMKEQSRKKAEDREADEVGAEFLARMTQGWSSNIEDDDGPIAYSHKAAVDLYLTQDWIAKQVLGFISDLGNFDPRRYQKPASGSKKGRGSTAHQKEAEQAE